MNRKIKSSIIKLILLFLGIQFSANPIFAQTANTSHTAKASYTLLFIGNSYTFAYGSPVRYFHNELIKDLNETRSGGVPALFKIFTKEAGCDYDVFVEAWPGKNFDFHFKEKGNVIGKAWDYVVMQGYSVLDKNKPGDPTLLINYTKKITELIKSKNPKADIKLEATWARADETYPDSGHWHGKSIEQMALDIRKAYDLAKEECAPAVSSVIPVGQAWNRAIEKSIADPNPYDGINAGQINLWTFDHYHASAFGYYLSALMIFGEITGLDPRSLGKNEHAAFELGFSENQTTALQQIAFEELISKNGRAQLKSFKPIIDIFY